MQFVDNHRDADRDVPPSAIYAALVGSLFENPAPMLAGCISAGIAALMTALRTGNQLIWPCALLIVSIGIVRALQLRHYQRDGSDFQIEEVRRWEMQYMIGGSMYAGALGLWCLVVLAGSDDAVAHLICVSVTVAYTAAGAGRTFGRPVIAQSQVALACGPMSIGLILRGDPYYIGFGLLNVFFFIGLRRISLRLHRIYVNALIAREREAALASQFDTALNNMPHGLCMFGADGRLGVMNYRFGEMMHLADSFVHRSVGAADVIAACVAVGTMSPENGSTIISEIENSEAGAIVTADVDRECGRALSWTFQPMAGGGTVVLVEDITERRKAEAKISHLARFDSLTELPNRLSFRDEILRAQHSAEPVGDNA
jgi:PAS domain-containing protein